jgi:hypothetical protein
MDDEASRRDRLELLAGQYVSGLERKDREAGRAGFLAGYAKGLESALWLIIWNSPVEVPRKDF